VAAAYLESTPLLVLSGQVKRADLVGNRGVRQIGFQEIDIVSIVKPVTKYAVTVMDPMQIRVILEEAVWHARSGRKGPVWVDIPLDVQASQINPDKLPQFLPPAAPEMSETALKAAQRTVELLRSARRPVLLIGNGTRCAGAVSRLRAWAELVRIPVLTTWKALDTFPDDHPLYVGRPGAVGQRGANFAQQTSDVFISVGARLDYGQTAYNHPNFARNAKRIIVDIDAHEIAKLDMEIDTPLAADAGLFVEALWKASEGATFPEWTHWVERCQNWRKLYPIVLPEYRAEQQGVNNYVFVDTLGQLLGAGDLLVPGSSGACSEITCQAIPAREGLRFINSQGLGSMGFGAPAAIGACMASGNLRTVCIDGDGGFPMNANELATAVRLGLNVKFFILNNNGYGSIRTTQINYFESRFIACDPSSGLTFPDLEKFTTACGAGFRRISSQINLRAALSEVLETPGTILCELMMTPGQFTQPKVSSKQDENGKMVTMPMEDLWPFLDRAELETTLNLIE
jgi:acetolactate synthase-1/2/3 large subunit